MLVKVRIPEFTYRDPVTNKPVTIVREGNVPDKHPAVQAGLKAGFLVPVANAAGRLGVHDVHRVHLVHQRKPKEA